MCSGRPSYAFQTCGITGECLINISALIKGLSHDNNRNKVSGANTTSWWADKSHSSSVFRNSLITLFQICFIEPAPLGTILSCVSGGNNKLNQLSTHAQRGLPDDGTHKVIFFKSVFLAGRAFDTRPNSLGDDDLQLRLCGRAVDAIVQFHDTTVRLCHTDERTRHLQPGVRTVNRHIHDHDVIGSA